jgi:hypothetical protein
MARFVYRAGGREFVERVQFADGSEYDAELLDRALWLAWVLAGTSYYKAFPTREVKLPTALDAWQVRFLDTVYQEGLGQFAYENGLTREDLAHFAGDGERLTATTYAGDGVLSLQSGGKDSLLVADLLERQGVDYQPWFVASGEHHPRVLDGLAKPLAAARREIDRAGLAWAAEAGGLNGHVPITYILQSYALVQAILSGRRQVLVAVGQEGVEPHAEIGDLAVNHQWSKTWPAEQLFAEYVRRYISPDLQIGSPLRQLSEVKIAQLFAERSWGRFGRQFSSCNVANYRQNADNRELKWCGNCPKCANMYLMFAPFVAAEELKALFEGQDLFTKQSLDYTYRGLLGVDGVMKPFECVGSVEELRWAYQHRLSGYGSLSFAVPETDFDVEQAYAGQDWARELLGL